MFFFFFFLLVNVVALMSFCLVQVINKVSILNLLSDKSPDKDIQNYECSFEYSLKSSSYSLQFYIVSVSFMLFDLEIVLFTPLVSSSASSGFFLVFSLFFLVLVCFFLMFELLTSAFSF